MPWIYERPNEYVVFCLVFYVKKSLSGIVLISIEPHDLRCRAHDQHGLGSKPTRTILLCPWERHFTALFPCLVVLASSSKLKS